MRQLIKDLCEPRTAIVSDGNEDLFHRISQEIDIDIISVESGNIYNGWEVPLNWKVLKALIYKDGKLIFDGKEHSLGVAYYSNSFSGELSWEELVSHLVTNPDLPNAFMFHCMWQYRPWEADWAFSVPYDVYSKLGPGTYRIELETRKQPGQMLIGVSNCYGELDRTIVFNSNNCHPHMANDGFAGTAVLICLMQWLSDQKTKYNYRLVIAPEHLGSVFYLRDLPSDERRKLVCGIFHEMPGTQGPLKVAKTFLGKNQIDLAFYNVLRHLNTDWEIVPWRKGAGNDETVWEAPGYEIPFVEFTRCENQFEPFKEYHSSLDNPDLIDLDKCDEVLEALKRVIYILENNCVIQRKFEGLICLSNPEYDLYFERIDPTVEKDLDEVTEKWGHLLDSLFRYMDGNMSILDIANKHDLPFDQLHTYLRKFEAKGLVELKFTPMERV